MHVIYCLINESFKENILSIGITTSTDSLKQILTDINKTYLPTPYTLFLTKNVHNPNRIEILYSLLCKFGKRINVNFFEIPSVTVKQLFDLVCDIEENIIVVQGGAEYIIPTVDYETVQYEMVQYEMVQYETMHYETVDYESIYILNELDNQYDRLCHTKSFSEIDL